jgi:hypothetical protein
VKRSARAGALAVFTSMALSAPAWADGPDASSCVDAYSKAQTQRNERKLVEARQSLLVCAQPTCKDFIVKDCTDWLDQVKAALPSIVPVALDAGGNAIFNVKVTMDGAQLVAKIDGRSVEVNPGPHTFVFENAADGTKAQKDVLVAEGEHEKRISVTLGGGGGAAPAGGAPAPAPAGGTAAAAGGAAGGTPAGTPPEEPPHKSSPLKLVGLVTAGLGVVGLGVGAVFGLSAMGAKNDAHCTSSNVCSSNADAQKLKDAGNAATMSTVFFIAGGVLAAGGITLFAVAPSSSVQVAPTVGIGSAGLTVQGGF